MIPVGVWLTCSVVVAYLAWVLGDVVWRWGRPVRWHRRPKTSRLAIWLRPAREGGGR